MSDILFPDIGMACTRPVPPTTLPILSAAVDDRDGNHHTHTASKTGGTPQPTDSTTHEDMVATPGSDSLSTSVIHNTPRNRGCSADIDSPAPHTPTPSSHMYTASDAYETEDYDTDGFHSKNLPHEGHSLLHDGLTEDPGDNEDAAAGLRGYTKNTQINLDILAMSSKCLDKAEEIARRVWMAGWTVVHHNHLPKWLRDNDFLICGHRPPLNSFLACFKSIFRVHTETGNIWTHLLGFVAFVGIACYFNTRPSIEIQWQEKAVFSAFFAGAILCMGFSWIFHTVYCHSEGIGKLFNKLDYCGIALLTMGSFVPWLYYSFYCRLSPKIVYLILIFLLGTGCIVVSMWDKFAEPKFRPVRAGLFIGLGLSGIIPAMHYVITDGFYNAIHVAALGWLVLMALLYITGAVIYASRFPERIWPGKFDIMFQSHQIFHVFVLAAAFVHFHGISEIANYRLTFGDCMEDE